MHAQPRHTRNRVILSDNVFSSAEASVDSGPVAGKLWTRKLWQSLAAPEAWKAKSSQSYTAQMMIMDMAFISLNKGEHMAPITG